MNNFCLDSTKTSSLHFHRGHFPPLLFNIWLGTLSTFTITSLNESMNGCISLMGIIATIYTGLIFLSVITLLGSYEPLEIISKDSVYVRFFWKGESIASPPQSFQTSLHSPTFKDPLKEDLEDAKGVFLLRWDFIIFSVSILESGRMWMRVPR